MGEIRLQCTITWKNAFKVLILVSVLFVIHILVMNHETTLKDYQVNPLPVRLPEARKAIRRNKKTILIWTPFNVPRIKEIEETCIKRCSMQCEVTTDKESIPRADAVSFYLTDLWTKNWNINSKSTIKFPTYRRPDQVWTLSNMEPPPNLFGDLRVFNGIFNWTIWYRKDSDLFQPYGRLKRLTAQERESAERSLKNKNFFKEKTNGITGKISNCKDSARRYRLVEDLRQYLDLDMFGKCYDRVCGNPEKHTSCDNITETYKFYLALENSRCKDYVTEKYWWSLVRNQIPIVSWDHTHINRDVVIPNSFISIYDYPNLRALSDYIKLVSENETLYNSYFEWKKIYKIDQSCMSCTICKALHENRPPQIIEDLDGWVRNDTCEKVGVGMLLHKIYRVSLLW